MKNDLGIPSSRNVRTVALAYFMNPRNLRDAATDLCLAGFSTRAINITDLSNGIKLKNPLTSLTPDLASDDKHTLRWRLRRFLAHDRHRRGADQISGNNPDPNAFTDPECIRMDLGVVLAQMNVPQAVVDLLERDTMSERTFMMVDAKDRVAEASEIMKRNFGQLRTDYLYSA